MIKKRVSFKMFSSLVFYLLPVLPELSVSLSLTPDSFTLPVSVVSCNCKLPVIFEIIKSKIIT